MRPRGQVGRARERPSPVPYRPRPLRLGLDFVSQMRPTCVVPPGRGSKPLKPFHPTPRASRSGDVLDYRIVTAISHVSTQPEEIEQHERRISRRGSQVGLMVVRGIISPFTSNAAIPALEHNGMAMLNVRAHAIRVTGRVVALVGLDVTACQALRLLSTALRAIPAVDGFVTERLDLLAGVSALQVAAALLAGLFLTGAYGYGDHRRNPRRILLGCAIATLLPLWGWLWTSPASAALQIFLGTLLLGASVLQPVLPCPLAFPKEWWNTPFGKPKGTQP